MVSKIYLYTVALVFLIQVMNSLNYNKQNEWTGSCTTGQSQSPINIKPLSATAHTNAQIHISPANLKDVQAAVSPDYLWKYHITSGARSYLKFSLKNKPTGALECQFATYTAIQFHFHRLSQHQINGQNTSIELHIVHQRDPKFSYCTNLMPYSVLGVLFNEDANASNNQFFQEIGIGNGTRKGIADLEKYLEGWFDQGVYNYSGSLTTPACSQVVNWIVSTEIQTISSAQKQQFDLMGTGANNNISNRSVQLLNSRVLYTISQSDVTVSVESSGDESNDDWKIVLGILLPLLILAIAALIVVLICCLKQRKQRGGDNRSQQYQASAKGQAQGQKI